MNNREQGTTLVELMIGVSISIIVIGVAYGLFIVAYQKDIQTSNRILINSRIRVAMQIITKELRPAGVIIDSANVNGSDADGDGDFGEDPLNGVDDDGDGSVDEDVSDDITVVRSDTNGSGSMTVLDNRVKISLDGDRNLVRTVTTAAGSSVSTTASDLNLWSMKIIPYEYIPADTFIDANLNGIYDSGETYNDDNNNGSYDNGFDSTTTSDPLKINAIKIVLVGAAGNEKATFSSMVIPRNIK